MTAASLIELVIEGKIREALKARTAGSPSHRFLTLAQKEGYRKAARTRERRQYVR
jgi:hypothetical protein